MKLQSNLLTCFLLFTLAVLMSDTVQADEATAAAPVSYSGSVLFFHSRHCLDCRLMGPIIEALRSEYQGQVALVTIDVDRQREESRIFKVDRVPTQIYFAAGRREVFRSQGLQGTTEIKRRINQYLRDQEE